MYALSYVSRLVRTFNTIMAFASPNPIVLPLVRIVEFGEIINQVESIEVNFTQLKWSVGPTKQDTY